MVREKGNSITNPNSPQSNWLPGWMDAAAGVSWSLQTCSCRNGVEEVCRLLITFESFWAWIIYRNLPVPLKWSGWHEEIPFPGCLGAGAKRDSLDGLVKVTRVGSSVTCQDGMKETKRKAAVHDGRWGGLWRTLHPSGIKAERLSYFIRVLFSLSIQ